MSQLSTYPLRLPRSIRAGIERVSRQDGTSINQFVSIAVAEKLAMLEAETFFTERAARADLAAFDQLMQRKTGVPPQDGDQITRVQSVASSLKQADPNGLKRKKWL